MEVLDQWLRNFPGRPTWRDVANALRNIGLQQLANDIEMVYETGSYSTKEYITYTEATCMQGFFHVIIILVGVEQLSC